MICQSFTFLRNKILRFLVKESEQLSMRVFMRSPQACTIASRLSTDLRERDALSFMQLPLLYRQHPIALLRFPINSSMILGCLVPRLVVLSFIASNLYFDPNNRDLFQLSCPSACRLFSDRGGKHSGIM